MEKVAPPPRPQQTPWLFFCSHGRRRSTQSFFSIAEGKPYVGNIRELSRKTCLMQSHGWLLMMDNKTEEVSLVNSKTRETIRLPPILPDDEFPYESIYEWCISSAPTDENCVVVCMACEEPTMMFCRPGDSKWRKIDYEMEEGDGMYEGGLWNFVTCSNGRLYGDIRMGRIAAVEFNPDPVVRLLGLPDRPQSLLGLEGQTHLVESGGEIFSVCSVNVPNTSDIITFSIYKADLVEEKWVNVQSIGDRAFFLCKSYSVSCSASESGIKGDSIYYVRSANDDKLYRFDMADKSISMDLPCPNLTKPWKAPHWILL